MAKLGKNSVSISDQTKAFPYLLEVLGLSLPIIFGNIGQIFIGTTETFVSGKHSGLTLAAIGLSQAVTSPFLMIGVGFLFGLSTLIAHKRGEGKEPGPYFRSSLFYGTCDGPRFNTSPLAFYPFDTFYWP